MVADDIREDPEEVEWIEQFRASGQNHYFEKLYERSRRQVFGVCLRLVKDFEQAEDLTHETFLRAYQRFPSMRGGHFRAWVCRIATNLCLNRIRDRMTQQRILEESMPVRERKESDTERSAILAQEMGIAMQIIRSLSPEQRTVLLFKYVEGYSYQEIEAATGYEISQIRSYLQNARRNFQIRWEGKIGNRMNQ